MARVKKEKKPEGVPMWLVTFSDLVTLLLTFFVLLLSMASMDKSILTKVNIFVQDVGFLTSRGSGMVPARILLLMELLEDPLSIMDKPDRFKDLLIPDEVLPPEIDRSTLEKNLMVLEKPEGVALVLTDKLLFEPGKSELTPAAKKILYPIFELLTYMQTNVAISGYSDSVIRKDVDNQILSGNRALSVLDFFVTNRLDPSRFSVAGYGPAFPLADNNTEDGRRQNRRVEILIKSQPFIGGYN